MKKKRKKRVLDGDFPIGKMTIIKDFLPPPGELALREKTVRLAQGDIILLYTDGVVEAATGLESETSTIFGEERLMEILRQLRGHSAQEIVSKVTGELKSFYQDQMPVDDYTLFVIQRIKGD